MAVRQQQSLHSVHPQDSSAKESLQMSKHMGLKMKGHCSFQEILLSLFLLSSATAYCLGKKKKKKIICVVVELSSIMFIIAIMIHLYSAYHMALVALHL